MDKINIHILGNFSITYGENLISFGLDNTMKPMKLLQLLLYQGSRGIAREKLLEDMYGREEYANVATNLRVTVHRLRRMLEESGLPPHDYIQISKGIYRWDAPVETEVDAAVFLELLRRAEEADGDEAKAELLSEACQMYDGEFMADLQADEWLEQERARYKGKYSEALQWLCEYKMDCKAYEETLKLSAKACVIYPFDEWQAVRIECFIALNRYQEALQEYEKTAKMFIEERGISLSERMLELFELMSSRFNYQPQNIESIEQHLREEEELEGSYFCSLPSFRDYYRLVSRIIERSGQSAVLMQCSIMNGKGSPIEKEKKLELMAELLQETIQKNLRKGDCFTKHSPSQFLILLVGIDKANSCLVRERIEKEYAREHKTWKNHLDFSVTALEDVGVEKEFVNKEVIL